MNGKTTQEKEQRAGKRKDCQSRRILTRRTLLKTGGRLTAFGALAGLFPSRASRAGVGAAAPQVHRGTSVAVIGAGAFGGWTALELLRRGARVTLLDAWGPGNARASSGGETRIIRGTYG
ncbi:MAG: FAD-dependent oxidoreductase, partial [Acidobacteriota bacterium]